MKGRPSTFCLFFFSHTELVGVNTAVVRPNTDVQVNCERFQLKDNLCSPVVVPHYPVGWKTTDAMHASQNLTASSHVHVSKLFY